jgi:hypothetical protein
MSKIDFSTIDFSKAIPGAKLIKRKNGIMRVKMNKSGECDLKTLWFAAGEKPCQTKC